MFFIFAQSIKQDEIKICWVKLIVNKELNCINNKRTNVCYGLVSLFGFVTLKYESKLLSYLRDTLVQNQMCNFNRLKDRTCGLEIYTWRWGKSWFCNFNSLMTCRLAALALISCSRWFSIVIWISASFPCDSSGIFISNNRFSSAS